MKRAMTLFAAVALAAAVPAHAKGKTGFDAYDKNNDGVITKSEAFGHPTLTKRFRGYDKNGDGRITRAEWLAGHAKRAASAKRSTQDQRFSTLDRNKDGELSRDEARGHLDRGASVGR